MKQLKKMSRRRIIKKNKITIIKALVTAARNRKLDYQNKGYNSFQKNTILDVLYYEDCNYIGYILRDAYLYDVYIHINGKIKKYDLAYGDIIYEYDVIFKRIEITEAYTVHLYV